MVTTIAQALARFGWVEGKNIRIDYCFAAGDPALLKADAAEVVGLAPNAILAGTASAVAALQQHTPTIPIVFLFVPIPSGWALFRASRDPAATSRDSPPSTRPSWENGCNC